MGYVIMNEGKKAINRVFITKMDASSRKRIIANADKVIDDIREYHKNLKLAETASKARTDRILESILKSLGRLKFYQRIFHEYALRKTSHKLK